MAQTVTVGMVSAALAAVGERDVSLSSARRVEVTKMIQAALDWAEAREADQPGYAQYTGYRP